jgi:hypothetical protein
MDNELKQCMKCKEYKERDLFSTDKSAKDGKYAYCKSCNAAKNRAFRAANPEYNRAWQKANPEKAAATTRAYREANPEKAAAATRAYREANREKAAANARAWEKANPEKAAESRRVCLYNLTNEKYQELLDKQNNSCKICLKPFTDTTPHIDHDHVCCPGKKSCGECVRGLLCNACNTGLGFFKDSAEILQSGKNYLDEYNQMQYTNKSNSESEDICNSQN